MKLLNPVTGQLFTARIYQKRVKHTVRHKLMKAIFAEGLVRIGTRVKHCAAEKLILSTANSTGKYKKVKGKHTVVKTSQHTEATL